MPARPSVRRAFTLLEVLLAMAIGIVLVAALYVAMNVQIRHAQSGRDVVEQSTLARSILARISSDIASSLGPITPGEAPGNSSQGSGMGSGQSSGGQASTNANSASTGASSPASSSSMSSSQASSNGQALINLGVQGDPTTLILSCSRVPRDLNWLPSNDPNNVAPTGASDLRRISYWLVASGDRGSGLARQEYRPVTSTDATTVLPPNIPDEASYVIAEEVKSLNFSYFDGSNWQATWDGTTPGPDGVTPIGPPVAIAVTIGVAAPSAQELKTYRHVVPIATANNLAQLGSGGTSSTSTSGTTGNSSPAPSSGSGGGN
jgi:prepilin-type N-terminal cleavage/methylation domain-containing protein